MKLRITREDYKVGLSILAIYLLTSLHHVYGAWLYATPWRNHIAYQGFTWLLISYLILLTYLLWRKRILMWIFIVFAGFFFIGAIGFYEGFYNHVLKNILYHFGLSIETLHQMYPPPKYLLPNDVFFEVTGILTFAVALWSLHAIVTWVKKTR